jgi:phage tail sheath protein FI
MPQYLAPGVYVEEVSYRTKSIEGVGTTTTAFVGPTRYGPLYDPLAVLTSLSDYEQIYGDGQPLEFSDAGEMDNFMWHAVRAFFFEGGSTLYVKRICHADPDTGVVDATAATGATGNAPGIGVTARYPGAAGNLHVTFALQAGQNVLSSQQGVPKVRGLNDQDVVLIGRPLVGSPPAGDWIDSRESPPSLGSPPSEASFVDGNTEYTFASALSWLDPATGTRSWTFTAASPVRAPLELKLGDPALTGATIQIITVGVSVAPNVAGALATTWTGLPLDPMHRLNGTPDSIGSVFAEVTPAGTPTPIVLAMPSGNGLAALYKLGEAIDLVALVSPNAGLPSTDIVLEGGTDGNRPVDADYEGSVRADDTKTGLIAFEDLDDISIVAAPGSTAGYAANPDQAQAVINGLITHAQKMVYRIAVIDPIDDLTIAQARAMRAQHDSSWAAFYYPWVRILDPITNLEKNMPPSGFISGIYARNDFEHAVYKAPANEVINLAISFERPINKAQQEVLNPEGINCLRFFEGRGYLVWGARTMSSDPEWKYVNLRRYFAFLEHSVDRGTQWAVFEPNGEMLWANVRGTLDEFLYGQWRDGALLGSKPESAYFVRCDRTTMTQDDLDNGRLVCLIGVAPLRPAEFVIFRIGQWTADAKL